MNKTQDDFKPNKSFLVIENNRNIITAGNTN